MGPSTIQSKILLSLYKVGILDNLFFHFNRVRHHSSLNGRIKTKTLWLEYHQKVQVKRNVSQAFIKVLPLMRKSVLQTCCLDILSQSINTLFPSPLLFS